MRRIAFVAAALAASAPAFAAGPCDGLYRGTLTVQGQQGVSVAPLRWRVADSRFYGGFEGPSGLYLVEGRVDARCNIVEGVARDYVAGEPMAVVGTVTEGTFKHNGPVRVTYRMQRSG